MRINPVGASYCSVQKNNNTPSFGMAVTFEPQAVRVEKDYYDRQIAQKTEEALNKRKNASLSINWLKGKSNRKIRSIYQGAMDRFFATNGVDRDYRIVAGAVDSNGKELLPILNSQGQAIVDAEGRTLHVRLNHNIMDGDGNPITYHHNGEPQTHLLMEEGPIFDINGDLIYNRWGQPACGFEKSREGPGQGPAFIVQVFKRGSDCREAVLGRNGKPWVFGVFGEGKTPDPKSRFDSVLRLIDEDVKRTKTEMAREERYRQRMSTRETAAQRRVARTRFAQQAALRETDYVARIYGDTANQ